MWYEISVSKNGSHFFATHEKSIKTHNKLIDVLKEFVKVFPEEDGFKISVTKWQTIGDSFDNKDVKAILSDYE